MGRRDPNQTKHRNATIPIGGKAWRRFLVGACSVLLAGCTGPQISPPGPLGLSPQAALQSVTHAAVAVPLAVTAHFEVRRFGERYSAKAALMMQQPDRLRFESLPPLGMPDLFLSIDQGHLSVFIPGQNVFYQGRATVTNLSRFLPLALPPAELVALLLGQPMEGEGSLQGRWEKGLYRIDRDRGQETDTFWVDPTGRRLVRWERSGEGARVLLTAEFGDPVPTGQGLSPRQLSLNVEGVAVNIRYSEFQTTTNEEAVFALPLPQGITPESLD